MRAPKSQDFIVCLNLGGGVPFLSSSSVQKGTVTWNGHDWNRFKVNGICGHRSARWKMRSEHTSIP
jgi:hypothetical protein